MCKMLSEHVSKRALKKHKRMRSHAHLLGLSDAIDSANSSKFWKVWNKYKQVGGHSDVSSLNANDYNTNLMNNFIFFSDNSISVDEFLYKYMKYDANKMVLSITFQDVEKACLTLRASNFLGYMDFTVRNFLYAHPAVFVWLTEMFNVMLIHGYEPEDCGKYAILPVIKDRSSAECASNYRPISIESVCTKLCEQYLVPFLNPFMSLHENQFGYVPAGGCNKALFTFRFTVQHFWDGVSRVYVVSLDLTKAFDHFNHVGLLLCLMKRGVLLCLINVLFCWFSKLRGTVW